MPAAVPLALTPFVGRDEEVESLVPLVLSSRLLTLTGAGGSGKTRLAAEVARRVESRFADDAGWAELAPLADAELLPTYLLDALGIEPGPRRPRNALIETLRERRMLLVLDNCEHLVEACAALADELLRSCPNLHILATSREALGVGGERAWLVPGLSVPQAQSESFESIARSPAVQLFVDRAEAAHAAFRLTPGNAGTVAQICRRLGSCARTAVPRHRTLREAIDWSYNLLDDREPRCCSASRSSPGARMPRGSPSR